MPFKLRGNFSSTKTNTGGNTGSSRVTENHPADPNSPKFFQLKEPITKNRLDRKLKAQGLDHENLGEYIAAEIAKAVVPKGCVPEVHLVSFGNGNGVGIASEYLSNDLKSMATLNKHLDPDNTGKEKGHVVIGHYNSKEKRVYKLEENSDLHKDLARALAISMLVGDHDVNPGNMIMVKNHPNPDKNSPPNRDVLVRIDMGHAFSDLLRFKAFGGGRTHPNFVIDFLNRETVSGFPKAAKSKLWRDYPALLPSQVLVDAMNDIISSKTSQEEVIKAIDGVKLNFQELIKAHPKDAPHIIQSLAYISEHVTGRKIDKQTPEALNQIFDNISDYINTNLEHMAFASKLMQLQLNINTAIRDNNPQKLVALEKEFKKLLLSMDLNRAPGEPEAKSIVWIKSSANEPAFKGNFEEYVAMQTKKEQALSEWEEIDKPEEIDAPAAGALRFQASSKQTMDEIRAKGNEESKHLNSGNVLN